MDFTDFGSTQGPSVLVFADRPGVAEAAAAAVTAAGGRPIPGGSVAGAIDRLDAQASVAAVVIDIHLDTGTALDRLLQRLAIDSGAGRYRSVITVPPSLIDVAAARLREGMFLLCDPDPVQMETAVMLALTPAKGGVRDGNRHPASHKLQELSEEAGKIARALESLSHSLPPRIDIEAPRAPAAVTAESIRAILRARRLRERFFPAELFADPAWDMLLDLTAARLEGRSVSVSSLCIAAAVPPTTALRWIKALTDQGMFVRVADPLDGRRIFVELDEASAHAIARYFEAAGETVTVV